MKIQKNLKNNNNYILYMCFFLVFLLYLSIFFLSSFKIVNFWSFSQAHISYSEGFIKRGLFGTIMFFFEKNFNVSTRNFFSIFHIVFYSTNIFLFFKLIKKYLSNKLLFIFFVFCPSLILFPFNDLGGYQRLDVLSITTMLIHSIIAESYYEKKINIVNYERFLFFILFPFIFVSILFHEIQIISLPLHFFITYGILNNRFSKTVKNYLFFLVPIFCVYFLYPNETSLIKLSQSVEQREIWIGAYLFHTKNLGLDHYINEIKINILTIYNFKLHLLMVFFSTIPFIIIFKYLKRNRIFLYYNKSNIFFFIVSPFFLGLIIGDFGRWVNLMSFAAFTYLSQFPLRKKLNDFKIYDKDIYKYFINLLILFIVIFYIFSIRIPHCCNLEEKNLNLFGGIIDKSTAIIKIILNFSEDDIYNLDKRFK